MAAEDISTLVLQVKSDGIKEGTDQLNALTDAAAKAEGAASKLSAGVAQTEAATRKASGSAKALADAEDTATKAVGAAVTAYQKKVAEQRRQIEMYNQSGKAYAQANADALRMNSAINASAAAMAKTQETAMRMNAEFDKRAASKLAADLSKAYDEAQRLNKAFDANVQAMGRLQSKANEMNKAWDENKNSVDKSTGAHGSNAGAIREVMVLMHELSQGSFKRFGGSMMVLTNQLDVIPKTLELVKTGAYGTVAAWVAGAAGVGVMVAAIGALALAYYKAGSEQRTFNSAVIQSGNFAGLAAGDFHKLAEAAAASHGTIGQAKEAVTMLAASGKFTRDQIAGIAESATLAEQAFGTAVDDTVKEYETLATLAVTSTSRSFNVISQHAMKLNDHYHFLTANQFEHIAQLEREGKAQQAVAELTDALHKAQDARAEEAIKKLGGWASAYHELKRAISGAMDELGRKINPKTDDDVLANLKDQRRAVSKNFATDQAAANSPQLKAIDAEILRLTNKLATDKAAAVKAGADAELNTKRIHSAEQFRFLAEANDKELKKTRELAELKQLYSVGDAAWQLAHAKEYEKAKAKIEADAQDKAPKGSDTRTADRDGEVDHLKETNRAKIEEMEGFITISKEQARKEDADRWSEFTTRQIIYDAERKQLATALEAEVAVYDKYAKNGKHTPRELAVNSDKRQGAIDRTNVKIAGVDRAEGKDKEDVYAAEDQEMDKLEKKSQTHYDAEVKRINDLVKAERIRLAGVDELKSVKMDAQAAESMADAKSLEDQYKLNQLGIELGQQFEGWSDRKVAAAMKDQAALQVQINGRKELARLYSAEAGKQRGAEEAMRITKNLDAGLDAAKRFEKGLVQAFGNVGKAIGGMAVAFAQMAKDRDTAQDQFNKASEKDKESGEAQARLESAQTDATLNGYASMTESARGFFAEKSKGYQIADGIAKGFHVAELARNAVAMVSNLATGASKMFAQSGWGGFAGVAAMAAVMAAFGISVAGSKNDGGQSAEEVQKTQGTGTVFGDTGTKNADGSVTYKDKSESILKSLDALKSDSNMMLPVNQAMLLSLQNIEAAMTGLTNLVVRTEGVTDGSNMGIKTGTLSRTGDSGMASFLLGTNAKGGAAGGAALGMVVGGPLGAAVGAIGGAIVGKIASLWGKTSQNIVDSGLQYGGKVSDLQSGKGYNQYASVDTTKSSWFGLSKSTSNSVKTQGLSNELSQQFGLIFTGLEDSLKQAAGTLGTTSDAVGKAIENMVISTSKISLKGLSGDDLTKAINAQISKTMDEIAQKAYPAMDAFRQVGEGYAQTVIRVASGVEQATASLEKLGVHAIAYTDIVNKTGDVAFEMTKQSIVAAEFSSELSGVGKIMQQLTGSASDLVDAYTQLVSARSKMDDVNLGKGLNMDTLKGAGDLKSLNDDLSKYYDSFFSASEKVAIETTNMTEKFAALGYTLPTERGELRKWIEEAAKTGDQLKVGSLLALVDGFDSLRSSMSDLAPIVEQVTEVSLDGIIALMKSLGLSDKGLTAATVTAAGGADKLTSSLNNYYDKYFSASEKTQVETTKMTDKFSALGYSLPKSRTELRTWIETAASTGDQLKVNKLLDLTDGFDSLQTSLDGLKPSLEDAFAAITKIVTQMKSIGLSDSGVTAQTIKDAGGGDNMSTMLDGYYDKYYNAGEKLNIETKKMTDQFTAVGYTLPKSREQLRTWIETAAKVGDQSTVSKLLALASGFDTLATSIEHANEDSMPLDMFSDAAVAAAKKAFEDAVSVADAAFNTLTTSINTQKTLVQKTIDNLKTMLSSVADAIKATAPSVTEAQSFANAMSIITGAVSTVRGGGDVTKIDGLNDALKTVSSQKDDSYSTALDFARSQAVANAALNDLKNAGDSQLTEAQRSLDLLDQQLETARQQLDQLKGINTGILSVADALKAFSAAMTSANAAKANYDAIAAGNKDGVGSQVEALYKTVLGRDSDAAGKAYWVDAINNKGVSLAAAKDGFVNSAENQSAQLDKLYQSVLGRTADSAGKSYWMDAMKSGTTIDEITKAFSSSDEAKHLPSFAVGTNYVPEDMVAQIHKGERIIPAADNEQLKRTLQDSSNGSGKDTSSLEAKIDDLIMTIQQGDVANVQKTNDMVKIIRDWTLTGLPPTRSDV